MKLAGGNHLPPVAKVRLGEGLEPFHARGQPLNQPSQLLMRLPQLQFQPPVDSSLPGLRVEVWETRVEVCPQLLLEAVAPPFKGVGGHKGCYLCQHLQAIPIEMVTENTRQTNQAFRPQYAGMSAILLANKADVTRSACGYLVSSFQLNAPRAKAQVTAVQILQYLAVMLIEHVKLTLHCMDLDITELAYLVKSFLLCSKLGGQGACELSIG